MGIVIDNRYYFTLSPKSILLMWKFLDLLFNNSKYTLILFNVSLADLSLSLSLSLKPLIFYKLFGVNVIRSSQYLSGCYPSLTQCIRAIVLRFTLCTKARKYVSLENAELKF